MPLSVQFNQTLTTLYYLGKKAGIKLQIIDRLKARPTVILKFNQFFGVGDHIASVVKTLQVLTRNCCVLKQGCVKNLIFSAFCFSHS